MHKRSANFKQYLTIRQAARYLGVSASTLRNWDRLGKVKSVRHPVNNYRLYRASDLRTLLLSVTAKQPRSGNR